MRGVRNGRTEMGMRRRGNRKKDTAKPSSNQKMTAIRNCTKGDRRTQSKGQDRIGRGTVRYR